MQNFRNTGQAFLAISVLTYTRRADRSPTTTGIANNNGQKEDKEEGRAADATIFLLQRGREEVTVHSLSPAAQA